MELATSIVCYHGLEREWVWSTCSTALCKQAIKYELLLHKITLVLWNCTVFCGSICLAWQQWSSSNTCMCITPYCFAYRPLTCWMWSRSVVSMTSLTSWRGLGSSRRRQRTLSNGSKWRMTKLRLFVKNSTTKCQIFTFITTASAHVLCAWYCWFPVLTVYSVQ